jgi:choline dehydrogenase-like flavoprotein
MDVVGADGRTHVVNVKCNAVVVSAGAIHSPALLVRSGLTNKNIGANLFLHPTGAVFASYDEPVNSWEGAPQTRLCDEFSNLDGKGYGFRIEASPAHPGLWALGLPWQSGEQHRFLMQQLPNLANSIVLTRDRYPGRVEVSASGQPVLHYHLHNYDAKHFMFGIEQALRIHRAAGAHYVYGPHNDCLGIDCQSNADFEKYIRQTYRLGTRPNHLGIFCAHQMSTNRIANSSSKGVITPEGETYEVKNLFVADGSALPTSTGVNPMISILATSHHLAQHIKAKLSR